MNYVKQQHSNGCMVACAAMIIGTDYWTAMQDALGGEAVEKFDGWSTFQLDHMLAEHGWAVGRIYQYSRNVEKCEGGCTTNRIREPWPLDFFAPLMHVMVKVFEGSNVEHSIVVENGVVFDPLFPERKTLGGYFRISSMAAVVRCVRSD